MLTVLVLMAGRGLRTQDICAQTPKPFITIHGIRLIDWVISNFKQNQEYKFVFVAQKSHSEDYHFRESLEKFNLNYQVLELEGHNDGAAQSALCAESFLNDELLIINSDQYITMDMCAFINSARKSSADGVILSMQQSGPKWSYAECDTFNNVTRIAEKIEISSNATVGAYWFRSSQDFIKAAKTMIERNDRINNEFYVAPSYNYLIEKKKKVIHLPIEEFGAHFYGLGTAEDIKNFTENPKSLLFANMIKEQLKNENHSP